jgi:CDP-diacylglycerol pyrophosphatase
MVLIMCVASKSLPLDKARQALLDDIIALYSCEPTIERVKRYTPDCVYDDQFVYANDRYGVLQYSLVP